jgi:threonine aldolase
LLYPVQSDAVFARLHPRHVAELQRTWTFHKWGDSGDMVRWMTAFDTQQSDVDEFLADIAAVAGATAV